MLPTGCWCCNKGEAIPMVSVKGRRGGDCERADDNGGGLGLCERCGESDICPLGITTARIPFCRMPFAECERAVAFKVGETGELRVCASTPFTTELGRCKGELAVHCIDCVAGNWRLFATALSCTLRFLTPCRCMYDPCCGRFTTDCIAARS